MGIRRNNKRSVEDRKKARKEVGPLKDAVVAKRTLQRYENMFNLFQEFVNSNNLDISTNMRLDEALCNYIGELWEEGAPKADASYSYAALRHFYITSSPPLHGAKRLLRTWERKELPCRAWPFTASVMLGVAGTLDALGFRRCGLLCVVMFHCCLRTAEGVELRRHQVQFSRTGRSAVLVLKATKTGQRHGVTESVVSVDCPRVTALLQELCRDLLPGDRLLQGVRACAFRQHFFEGP